jgi:nucleoside-diphosphate-sugar epimerase
VCLDLQRRGYRVRAAIRNRWADASLPADVERVRIDDIGSATAWRAAIGQADAVVHLLARTHVVSRCREESLELYHKVNVVSTRALLAASVDAGVRKLLYMSSVKAVCDSAIVPVSEATPCRPVDYYGMTKLEAERVVQEVGTAEGLEWVILRPPLVYGPGVKGNFFRLLRAVAAGVPLPLGRVSNARSMVFIDNLTDLVGECIGRPSVSRSVLMVADDTCMSTKELATRLGEQLDRSVRLIPLPVWLMRWSAQRVGRGSDAEHLLSSLVVSTARVRRLLAWAPAITVDAGLAATVEWFRNRNATGARGP